MLNPGNLKSQGTLCGKQDSLKLITNSGISKAPLMLRAVNLLSYYLAMRVLNTRMVKLCSFPFPSVQGAKSLY